MILSIMPLSTRFPQTLQYQVKKKKSKKEKKKNPTL